MIDLHWHRDQKDSIGNAYGYSVHNTTLKKFLSLEGVNFTDQAEDAVHIVHPKAFSPYPDKKNWLFTMYEGLDVPSEYVDKVIDADYLLVPSEWCKTQFSTFFPSRRIFVVSHGVEPFFTFKTRKNPLHVGKKFRYLWVGAPNTRKGWQEVVHVWQKAGFQENPMAELYMKTTVVGRKEQLDNVILDARNISRKQLLHLYHRSNCFLFPTRGEGFGLTLAVAMRTGLPCIAPSYSGVTDFFNDDVGYTIEHELRKTEMAVAGTTNETHTTRVCYSNATQLAEAMMFVAEHYEQALVKGRLASERIRNKFTWQSSARTLIGHVIAERMNRGGN